MDVPDLTGEPLLAIIDHVRERIAAGDETIRFAVLDPDRGQGRYAGEPIAPGLVHRPLRVWVELADRLALRLGTPWPLPDDRIALTFTVLHRDRDWRATAPDDVAERYGADSGYQRIHKLEDPSFVLDFADAIERARLPPNARVLDLGVNTGDSLELLGARRPDLADGRTFVGIDHSASAIALARTRFPAATFHCADLADLPKLDLPRFDLVMSIGTLHSPGVDDRAVLRHLVAEHLLPTGSVILGVPNCSYVDGELLHGAKMVNFTQPDLSLLVKSVAFYKKYLQQHRRRVFVTGRHYVLVTGVPWSSDT